MRLSRKSSLVQISERVHRILARQNGIFSRIRRFFTGSQFEPPTYFISRWLFLRLLGAIYFIAFASLWTQLIGLIGHNGILPAHYFLAAARQQMGPTVYRLLPTFCWFSANDWFLEFLCGGGTLLSVGLIFGITPVALLFILWAFYLSLVTVCRDFLSFQWDALLLETGFLGIFLAPPQILPKFSRESHPSRTVLGLLRWLLFRLMFSSGVVKLASGDTAWRNLTALNYHYETQPLPNWISWYMHQLPAWFQQASTATMFVIELFVPFLIFAPRRLRYAACAFFIFLQLMFMATGNYAFFNLLAIALCIPLLDDVVWLSLLQRWPFKSSLPVIPAADSSWRWPAWVITPIAAIILSITVFLMFDVLRVHVNWPRPIEKLYSWIAPFASLNSYGLFAVMTTSRPEIIIEGSNDGVSWHEYEFKYKPGELTRRPPWVAPHQPRLDWQMWFAALGNYQDNPWFLSFCKRLLQGAPEVLDLLAKNPFPGASPRLLRAVLYEYHFTDFAARRTNGTWWGRERKSLYCPVLQLPRR
jgi:lipase maturation factor 1